MAIPNSPVYKSKMRGTVYIINFIFALQMATVGYFGANYLKFLGLPKEYIAFVYAATSLVAIVAFFFSSYLFNKFGAYRSIFVSVILYFLSYVAQAYVTDLKIILPIFILASSFSAIVVAGLDALMERFTDSDETTGAQRGIFLTMASAAFVFGPFLGGLLAKGNDFKSLWLAGAGMLFSLMILLFWRVRKVERKQYSQFHIVHTVKAIYNNKNALYIFLAQFVLYFFYSIMVIYTSVYLHETLNWSFDKIGLALAIALLPFAIFTVPLGKLADEKFGEQEMLIIGFIIMGAATVLFGLLKLNEFAIVASVLFATRVGASMVQTMTETYFFKLVDGKDADLISAFRAMYPLSSVIAPLLAAPVLFVSNFNILFALLGLVTFSGVYFALQIEDTK